MRQVKCESCDILFDTTARNVKRCPRCRKVWSSLYLKDYYASHYIKKGYNGFGEQNNNWKNGIGKLKNGWNKILKDERRYCERCNRDLKFVTRYLWAIHHKDHDRTNNNESNLELLCKRCHQIEHECHKAFEGAETIPHGSTCQETGKRETSQVDDDIVRPQSKD